MGDAPTRCAALVRSDSKQKKGLVFSVEKRRILGQPGRGASELSLEFYRAIFSTFVVSVDFREMIAALRRARRALSDSHRNPYLKVTGNQYQRYAPVGWTLVTVAEAPCDLEEILLIITSVAALVSQARTRSCSRSSQCSAPLQRPPLAEQSKLFPARHDPSVTVPR